jgi:fatty acid desaturase
MAAARPQERMALRRMADASLALAERRPDDLKVAVERLGQAAPSGWQLFMLRFTGLIVPPPGSSILLRARGILIVVALILGLLAVGAGIVQLVGLIFGGVGLLTSIWLGLLVIVVAFGVLAVLGRRRQATARARRAAGP